MNSLQFILMLCIILITGTPVFAQKTASPPPDFKEQLGKSAPLDIPFTDEEGKEVTFRQIMGKKPAIVTLVYYRCPGKCSPLLNNLADTLASLSVSPESYKVITLSIDPSERPELAAEKKKNYLASFEKPFPEQTWRFLTGREEQIRKFADSIGYSYRYEEDQYVHPLGLVFLSPEGRITRYLNGILFLPFDLEMGLMEASEGKVGSPVRRALMLCYSYDPGSRKYVFSITRIAGAVILCMIILFIIYLRTKETLKKREKPHPDSTTR